MDLQRYRDSGICSYTQLGHCPATSLFSGINAWPAQIGFPNLAIREIDSFGKPARTGLHREHPWIEIAIEGIRVKTPRSTQFRATFDEIFAQAKISPTRAAVSKGFIGIFAPTPIVRCPEALRRMELQFWQD
ncbi:MAG TPA: hypothetical protein VIW27_01040 [Gammaproteobacteria bacterium]|jgi:hypothetical protein